MKVVFRIIDSIEDSDHGLRSHKYLMDNFTHNVIYEAIRPNDDLYDVGMILSGNKGDRYIGSKYYELYFRPLRDVNLNSILQ